MVVATGTAILGAAAIGGATAIGVGAMNAKAAKKAGQAQARASDEAIRLQREQMANSFRVLAKYGVQGDWARNQIAAFMGGPQTSGNYAQTPDGRQAGGADYNKYFADSPDLQAEWKRNSKLRDKFGNDPAAYAEDHYRQFGEGEGRQLPTLGGGEPPGQVAANDDYKTPDQLREEAWHNYQASPFAKIAQTNATKAKDEFTSMAGAQGSALSGRTARGMAEVGNEMEQNEFGKYFSALSGMADTGFEADSGIASGGQTFADRAGSYTMAAGDAKAGAINGEAGAWDSALSDVAGWAGWAAGAMPGKPNVNTGQIVHTAPRSPMAPSTAMYNTGRRRIA